jgi:enoyl-CoA hydratase/carnithine racemase
MSQTRPRELGAYRDESKWGMALVRADAREDAAVAYETILYEVADEIATVTLNRPTKLNAYTAKMGYEIVDAMRQADDDSGVRVIILTGAGRAFCAGADISGFADNLKSRSEGGSGNSERRGGMLDYPPLMRTLRKPSIVAINGIALGIGATMSLPCDIRIMADTAKMGFIFSRVGLMPELGSSYFLPRLIGASRAAEVMLTGRHYAAAECLQMGLVSAAVPTDNVIGKAREMAAEIILGSPLSLALTRRGLQQALNGTLESAMEFEGFALGQCYSSPEHREYVSAFLEKRKPDLARLRK